ncbi:hypothetical protein [Bacillus sp. FJAT-27251]|uniref:hypothetical protein n=1 Tax=Bacillus sp. FJAT-27251 TaxID=1684142 RepID=UPI0006A7B36D|nr:hypothetical protein [Bacillus sp. FJAT-27251]
MMNSNASTEKKYQEAIQSLRKINDDLFYGELKQLIKEREDAIAAMNEAVYQYIEKMDEHLKSFPDQVSGQVKEDLIVPQQASLERFNGNLADMESRMGLWQSQYQDYLVKTENLLSGMKELLREDQEFAGSQTEKVLSELRKLEEKVRDVFAQEFSEQASKTNVKYDAVSERLHTILLQMDRMEEDRRGESEHWQQQISQVQLKQREIHTVFDQKWKMIEAAGFKTEKNMRKWLVGLAIGQGVALISLVLLLIK